MCECVCQTSLSQVAVAGLFWGRDVTIRDYVLKGKGLELQCETSF